MVVDLTSENACNDIILIIDKMMSPDNRKGLVRNVRCQEYKHHLLFIRCILYLKNERTIFELIPMNITGRNQIVPKIESYIEKVYPEVEVRIGQTITKSKPAFTIHATTPYSLRVYDTNYYYNEYKDVDEC